MPVSVIRSRAEATGPTHVAVARTERPGDAACRGMGPDFFFPSSSAGIARATRVCARCRVAAECLAIALDDPSRQGIWGGTSARDRRYMRNEEGLGWG